MSIKLCYLIRCCLAYWVECGLCHSKYLLFRERRRQEAFLKYLELLQYITFLRLYAILCRRDLLHRYIHRRR